MKRLSLLLSLICLIRPIPVFAVTNPYTPDENTVSATIPDSTVSIPHLQSPTNGFYTTNATSLIFTWQRSSADTGIDHYSFYRDDIIVAENITEAANQDTPIFTASLDSGYVYLTFKTRISEGTHTWKVVATGSQGTTASSETWQFTVDTTVPDIIVQAVDKNKMYWATHDPTTIPAWEQRQLIVTTADPLLSGKVEANSNIKFSLVGSQSVTVLETDGNWEHRFRGLAENVTYSVFITATDVAGNSNSFPEFTITYQPFNIVAFLFPTPTDTPTPTPSLSRQSRGSSAKPGRDEAIHPDGSPPRQPAGRDDALLPPPPPVITTSPVIARNEAIYLDNGVWFILFGLLLHLGMTFWGAAIHLHHLPGFVYTLLLPFIGEKPYLITPFFATVTVFDPANLSKEFFCWVSNIKGKIFLDFPQTNQVFIQLTHPGYQKESLLLPAGALNANTVIKLKPKDHPSALERLRLVALSTRIIPLLIADITSLVVLIYDPSPYVFIYFLLAFILTYSEYLYPHL